MLSLTGRITQGQPLCSYNCYLNTVQSASPLLVMIMTSRSRSSSFYSSSLLFVRVNKEERWMKAKMNDFYRKCDQNEAASRSLSQSDALKRETFYILYHRIFFRFLQDNIQFFGFVKVRFQYSAYSWVLHGDKEMGFSVLLEYLLAGSGQFHFSVIIGTYIHYNKIWSKCVSHESENIF